MGTSSGAYELLFNRDLIRTHPNSYPCFII